MDHDLEKLTKAIDRLGLNYGEPSGPPGAGEKIAMELAEIKPIIERIAEALETIAESMAQPRT
jgi:hypothetical protein